VHVVETESNDTVIADALQQIERLHAKGIAWNTIAILVHTNHDGQAIQEALFHRRIPARLKTSSSLRHHSKIAALVAMVAYLYRGEPIDAEALLERTGLRLSQLDMQQYNVFMSPLQMLDRLIRETGYFDNDPNLFKLLEFAASYDDIATFLDDFALSDIPLASQTIHGIQIMTIHSSKGLEFDHVVVLDRLTRPPHATHPLLFAYDERLHIQRIFYRMEGRKRIDAEYAAVIEQQQIETHKDHLNLLYVALTRAAIGLTVLRKPDASIFDLLGMEPLRLGTIEPSPKSSDDSVTPRTFATQHVHLRLRNYGYQEKPKKEDATDSDRDAILFGTALHYALEMLALFEYDAIDQAIDTMRNRYGRLLTSEQIDAIRRRIVYLVRDPTFQQLIDGALLRREQPIAYQGEFKQIDLLIEHPDHCIVVDYKSSESFTTHHHAQVRHYIQAIEAITDRPTQGVIAYLLDEEIKLRFV
jgi:exodeoxyribonuclease V beta subunit